MGKGIGFGVISDFRLAVTELYCVVGYCVGSSGQLYCVVGYCVGSSGQLYCVVGYCVGSSGQLLPTVRDKRYAPF